MTWVCPAAVLTFPIKAEMATAAWTYCPVQWVGFIYYIFLLLQPGHSTSGSQSVLWKCACHNMNQSQGKCFQLTSVVTLQGKQLRRIKILSLLFISHWDVCILLATLVASGVKACAGLCRQQTSALSPHDTLTPQWSGKGLARVSGMLVSHESETGARKRVLGWLCLVMFWWVLTLECLSNSWWMVNTFAEFLAMWDLLSQAFFHSLRHTSEALWGEDYRQERK